MKYLMIARAIIALPAQAFEWPWEKKQLEEYSYCKGFVHSGLASSAMTDRSRIKLWLDWNHAVRAQFEQGGLDQAQYDAGQNSFGALLASNDTDGILEVVNQDCDYGNG